MYQLRHHGKAPIPASLLQEIRLHEFLQTCKIGCQAKCTEQLDIVGWRADAWVPFRLAYLDILDPRLAG